MPPETKPEAKPEAEPAAESKPEAEVEMPSQFVVEDTANTAFESDRPTTPIVRW